MLCKYCRWHNHDIDGCPRLKADVKANKVKKGFEQYSIKKQETVVYVAPTPPPPPPPPKKPDNLLETKDGVEVLPPVTFFGYLLKEKTIGSKIYTKYFYKIDFGEMLEYNGHITPETHENAVILNMYDLDGWVLSFPSESTLLLSPRNRQLQQLSFREENPRRHEEYENWALALFEHISFMNAISGSSDEVPAELLSAEEMTYDSPRGPNDELQTDYIDSRGIRMCLQYDDGPMPEPQRVYNPENFTFEQLQVEIAGIMEQLNAGIEIDSERLDYLIRVMDTNPDFKLMKEKEMEEWRQVFEPYTQDCLRAMRGYVPPHIFSSTTDTLVKLDQMPPNLAKRIISKKCLWLIRLSTLDIARIHIADLTNRFNPQAQGLDIVELAAVYAALPKGRFPMDDARGSKAKWRAGIEECLKSLFKEYRCGTIPPGKVRNAVYEGIDGLYTEDEVYIRSTTGEDSAYMTSLNSPAGGRQSVIGDARNAHRRRSVGQS
jgi:hypothetical protein